MGGGGTRVARYGFRNLSHHEQTTLFMRVNGSKDVQRPPPWYHVMTDYPPATVLARPLAVQLQDRSRRLKKYKKPSKMFIPQQISHPEDKLRKEFFSDHPWELARPRILLENDGKDAERWDWSKAYEEGRPMDGESVIKRQQYLMNHPQPNPRNPSAPPAPLSRSAAYDQARKELYERRHLEEMEARIQYEEALAVNAQFGKSAMEVGMELENRTFELWKGWAQQQVTLVEQARNATSASLGTDSKEKKTLEDAVDVLNSDGPEARLQEI